MADVNPAELLAPEITWTPWWWQDRGPIVIPDFDLPPHVDVLIVGAGYTGLSAALTLARAGVRVLVCELGDPGEGASSRNGGMVGDRLRFPYTELRRRFGERLAGRMVGEARQSVDYVERLIQECQIDCHFSRMGRFYGANRSRDYDAMARELEAEHNAIGGESLMVPQQDQGQYTGSPIFHGGRLNPMTGGLQPALFHAGLLSAVQAAGAMVTARTGVLSVDETDNGMEVETSFGMVRADKVLICTNGYSGPAIPEIQRRVIPIRSTIIATTEIGPAMVESLMPGGRMTVDSLNILSYFRPTPDRQRILLGSRPGIFDNNPRDAAISLIRRLVHLFPQLSRTEITHCWSGLVAYAFDSIPKVGMTDRLGYAMCYGGSGVAMSTWLGHKLAQKALNDPLGRTAFDDFEFPTRWYYHGRPWFLPVAMAWYNLVDTWRMRG